MSRRSAARPYAAADLFRDVLDGCLVTSPAPTRTHQRVVTNLAGLLIGLVPDHVEVLCGSVVVLPSGDGPAPDLVVTTASDAWDAHGIPIGYVPTVVEVVTAATGYRDRVRKRDLYAEAGIDCYWRVELDPWPGYRGPLPVIFARVRQPAGWREVFAPPGEVREIPLAVGRGRSGLPELITVVIDPGRLSQRWSAHRPRLLPGERGSSG